MAKKDLEKVLDEKVKPLIDHAMQKFLGVTINEIKADITDRIMKSPLMEYEVDTTIRYKQAKDNFRRYYLLKLFQKFLGNVSKVAEITGLDRRSIHRLIKRLNINVGKIRKEMLKQSYVKQEAVKGIIEHTLDAYKESINPQKFETMYKEVPGLSQDIIKELPDEPMTLKAAEIEFEKKYISQALTENKFNISQTARTIGLRYETLHRKMKSLGI